MRAGWAWVAVISGVACTANPAQPDGSLRDATTVDARVTDASDARPSDARGVDAFMIDGQVVDAAGPMIDGPMIDGPMIDAPGGTCPAPGIEPAHAPWFQATVIQDLVSDAAGNTYVTGTWFSSGVYYITVESYGPGGTLRWARQFENDSRGKSIAIHGDEIYVAGDFIGSLTLGSKTYTSIGSRDLYVLVMSTSGEIRTSWSFGTTSPDEANGIGVDAAGSITFAGNAGQGTIDFGGASLSSINGNPIGGFVVSFTPTGAHRWSHGFGYDPTGGSAYVYANDLAVNDLGTVAVTGWFYGSADFGAGQVTAATTDGFLVLYDASGGVRVVRRVDGDDQDSCYGVAITCDRVAISCVMFERAGGADRRSGLIRWFTEGGDDPRELILLERTADTDNGWWNQIAFDRAGQLLAAFQPGDFTINGQQVTSRDDGPWVLLSIDPSSAALTSAKRIGDGAISMWLSGLGAANDNRVLAGGSFYGTRVDFGFGPIDTADTDRGYLVHTLR